MAAFFIFVLAVGVRAGYVAYCYLRLGPTGLMGADSRAFLLNSQYLADGGSIFQVGANGQAGFVLDTMPIAFWLMSWTLVPGTDPDPLGYVLLQCVVDAGTCLLIGLLAAQFSRELFVPAALLAALNPTQIVVAGMVYTDTPFLFFVTAGLVLSVLWLKAPDFRVAVGVGLVWGLALMTRPFVLYWLYVLPILLFVSATVLRHPGIARRCTQVVAMTVLVAIVAAPVALRNFDQFGTMRLSAQSGAHLLYWVVPLVGEFKDGTPREESNRRLQQLYKEWGGTQPPRGTFESSERMMEIAKSELLDLGPGAIATAWAQGAAMNLLAPATTITPPVTRLPRSGFYDTPGKDFLDKVWNFLFRNDGAGYAQILLLSALPMPVWILFAVAGIYIAFFRRQGTAIPALFLFLWAGFTLALNGPVFSPKYRLPLEPAWIVFVTITFASLWRRFRTHEMVSEPTPLA
jgi:4-amino-4-deoxy-L-arabinose transferase-like glycosyltransferase